MTDDTHDNASPDKLTPRATRLHRGRCLQLAVDCSGIADADKIVAKAQEFYDFIQGKPPLRAVE